MGEPLLGHGEPAQRPACGYVTEVVTVPVRGVDRHQAMCHCGYEGPVRIFLTDALRDAREHGRDV